ncbi:MAG TPA: hypothetical protein VEJ84_16825 [Acidimicrobiales bacterium]|nr:hypothetical protein [Acidimicrobiales bacterium]
MSREYVALQRRGGSLAVLVVFLVAAVIAVGIVDAFNTYLWQSAVVSVGVIGVGVWVALAVRRGHKRRAAAQIEDEVRPPS